MKQEDVRANQHVNFLGRGWVDGRWVKTPMTGVIESIYSWDGQFRYKIQLDPPYTKLVGYYENIEVQLEDIISLVNPPPKSFFDEEGV
jgi:hypothetical protein